MLLHLGRRRRDLDHDESLLLGPSHRSTDVFEQMSSHWTSGHLASRRDRIFVSREENRTLSIEG